MMSDKIQDGKGKERAIDLRDPEDSNISAESDSDSDSEDSDSGTSSDLSDDSEDQVINPQIFESLIERARKKAASVIPSMSNREGEEERGEEEEILVLQSDSKPPIPKLNPGTLPPSYFPQHGPGKDKLPSLRDPDAEMVEKASSKYAVPAPPAPPPELSKSGKPLTKKERKELKDKTAGPNWFDLPAPSEADLPRMYREVEALRLRNQLDPKRFYRKQEGEGKGIKGLPKHFAIGTVVTTNAPFGGASSENLTRAERKRTLVDELVDDAESKRYAKRKFDELQTARGAKGRNTLQAKMAARKPKW
ncbi:Fcf2-domain-containing protein [Dendrothele bispora CBS 962.96]|uniref:Fcf2-domain-containing protein n=1 Tax=Dendrothele bispora (strain CBS 962.96) TaxID=1314807 RepID=A0A4S8MSB4_DENBC|nr:Fcf2-domain-containing protein [Dendrothele bispora CBS 962.96]